jgi:adenylate cyclase
MLAFSVVRSALESTRAIFDQCLLTPAFPIPHAGAYHGPAVARSGEYLGNTVNIAARIASLARSGRLLSGALVARGARLLGIPVPQLRSSALRNLVEPVDLYEVHLVASTCYVIDPVCRMRLHQDDAVGRLRYEWFCSLACAEHFSQTPRT